MNFLKLFSLFVVIFPLLGSVIAGLAGPWIGKRGAHWVTVLLTFIAFCFSLVVLFWVVAEHQTFTGTVYTWGTSGRFHFEMGFMIDALSAVMMSIVTFVSFLIHIYSIGYMEGDPGNQRFFSYVSLFTFAMLLLVTANNFFQLFVGWEGVGLVSYLLIGFWFSKESAARGGLKAFIVNRVGDFGFILGISAILSYFSTLDYQTVFLKAPALFGVTTELCPHGHCSILSLICILLFVGAMAKSAQIPLHVWLPESMEGPTPISALIHAATMVTAGVFMVARMSPLYELSQTALSFVLVIGATGGLFLGLLAFVENDIKRVIAYSTMSQLGYMMAANGVSAFSAGIFHLLTHACFKSLLFLSAGSVIIALHHEQDLRKMGNLKKYLPVTYACFLVGALALSAIPPFSGYYSKDAIIEAVRISSIPGAHYAYWCLLLGAFVTAFYIFRAFFMAFHTKERMSEETKSHLKETHWTMLLPMILLAVPSLLLGGVLVQSILYGTPNLLSRAIQVLPQYNVLGELAADYPGFVQYTVQAVFSLPFWLSVSGIVFAWFCIVVKPQLQEWFSQRAGVLKKVLLAQYGFEWVNDKIIVRGGRFLADLFFHVGDIKLLDHHLVDGSGRRVTWISRIVRRLQTGYLYHYAFTMIISLIAFLAWLIW